MISSGCRNCGHPIRPHFANRSSRITGPCASRGGCSRDNFAHLAPPLSPRHHSAMGQDRKSATAQETFSSADRVASGDERRHVLPKDLPNAVKHLNDEELDRLLVVTLAEAKRRGRHTTPKHFQTRTSESAVSLTRGQLNAVRAAFQAGITPARIARQFGLSVPLR